MKRQAQDKALTSGFNNKASRLWLENKI